MEFILFLIFVFLVFSHFSLKGRVSRLEEQILGRDLFRANTERGPVEEFTQPLKPDGNPAPEHQAPEPAFEPLSSPMTPIPTAPLRQAEPTEEAGEFFLYDWFREQTLIKVGSIIFFLGAVWFVSYAIESGWISELARIILGLLLACAVYVVGFWRKTIEPTQYQTLTVLGTGIFLGTVIASQFAFVAPVLPPGIAFLLMVISIFYTLGVAFQTKTEWLAIVASVAGLCAPLLVKFNEPMPILLLTYILLLSISFLAVVFFTSWRAVSLTLLVGSSFHLAILSNSTSLSDNMLWLFVVCFSALFCASTSISVTRTNTPTIFDVSSMAIITLQFILYAIAYALLPGLALFVAATVTAFIGYALRMRSANADSVSLFVAVSLIFSLVGTAELFDGFVLTIAYAFEVLAIYLLSLRLATVERSVIVAAALFIIPFLSGFMDLRNSAWNEGIINAEALGTISVLATLGFAVIWTLRDSALQAITWLRQTAGALLVGWYVFAVSASIVVANSQKVLDGPFVLTLLLLIITGSVITYILNTVSRDSWRAGALFTLIAPTISALSILSLPVWSEGISHQPFWAAVIFFFGLVIITTLYWIQSKKESATTFMSACAYALVWVILGYGVLLLTTVWNALLDGDMNRIVTSISYTILIYLTVNCLMFVKASADRIATVVAALILPGLLLLESLNFLGWSDGLMGVDAVGLYVTITIFVLLGTTLRQYEESVPEKDKSVVSITSSTLYVISGLLVFALVWIMSQTAFASEAIAVTVALFIYTVAGLASYSIGRITANTIWRRVGVLLLSTVILRLALIDIWGMELVWKIVTFLGIGLLFIMTALLERSRDKDKVVENITSEE